MSQLSNEMEASLINHLFRGVSYPVPEAVWIGLCATPLGDENGMDLGGKELANSGGYARIKVNTGTATWGYGPVGSGMVGNLATQTFTATADWGWISGVFIASTGTWGTGMVMFYAPLGTPKPIGNGESFSYGVSGLRAYFA